MYISDVSLLAYLHDATLVEVRYNCRDGNERAVEFVLMCAADAGYPVWDGRRLTVRLESLVLLSMFVFGAVAGEERLDSWGSSVSPEFEAELRRLEGMGIDCSGVSFSVSFHSGSVLQGLCRRINVVTMDE